MLLPSRMEPVEAEMRSDKRCSRNRGKKLLLKWQWNTCGWIKQYAAKYIIKNRKKITIIKQTTFYLYQIHWHKPHKIFVARELLQILAKSDGLPSLSKGSLAKRQSDRNGTRVIIMNKEGGEYWKGNFMCSQKEIHRGLGEVCNLRSLFSSIWMWGRPSPRKI